MIKKLLASLLVLAVSGCPSVTVDKDEVGQGGPMVEFDPAAKIIPFPNNLLLDPATGKVALPQQCNESPATAATRAALNQLDGFGTYEPTLNVTFTEAVDLASLPNHVLLYERVRQGVTLDPLTATPIPVFPIPGKAIRYANTADLAACTDPVMVEQVTFVPMVALDQKSTYTVALVNGIKTAVGADFNASFTWSLIRHPEPVVVIDDNGNVITNRTPLNPDNAKDRASLAGIDLLWKTHAKALSFLAGTGHDPGDVLLAWEFNTQTTTDPLDPAVTGSPASSLVALPVLGNSSAAVAATSRMGAFSACPASPNPSDPVITAYSDTQCFLRVVIGLAAGASGAAIYPTGNAACASLGCAAINDVLGSLVMSKQYLMDAPNTTYTGTGTAPLPGPWSDPIKPAVVHDVTPATPLTSAAQAKLGAIVIIPQPTTANPLPAAGWPVVIFEHGITRSRNDVLAVAGGLANAGFAVIAIDAVNHGSRAVRISNATNTIPALDCTDVATARPDNGPDPTSHSRCYAPVFSSNLAATRDAFRQTVLDLEQVVKSVKACGTTLCGKLKVDATKIFYMGHSLIGGSLGAMLLPMTDIKAGVLNAAAAGWLDVIENTDQTVAFQCPLVDALIDAGALTGAKFNVATGMGLCTTDAWKTAPGYRQFAAIGRWLLDPADPANFAARLAAKRFLLQEIENDEVAPNIATDNLGALAGQLQGDASCGTYTNLGTSGSPNFQFLPSTAILATPTESLFLDYLTFAPGSAACPPGNTYSHGALLKPTPSATGGTCNPSTGVACDGVFATIRLQTDAGFYLLENK